MVRYLLSDWIERDRGTPGAGASDADAQPDHVDQLPNEIDSVCRSAERQGRRNAADGRVISMCDDRHRHQEWLQSLTIIDGIIPPDKQLHLIADNYATHKHRKVQRSLAKHPRFHVHFTPTSSSWLNMVERFFRDLTDKRIRRGVFRDVEELITAIGDYIDQHNRSPKPFIWTAKASDILEKVKRARKALDNLHSA